MKRFIFFIVVALFIVMPAKKVLAATEFVAVVDPGNGSGTDYTSLSAWENSFGTIDLTSADTKVFSGTTTGTLSDGVTVYQCRGGAYQNVSGTMTHDTATQALVKTMTPGATFQANDVWYTNTTCNSASYHTISNVGDSAIAVAKCRTTTGVADTAAVTINGWTTSAANYLKIWTDPSEGYRHQGKWDEKKYRVEISGIGIALYNADYAVIDGLQIRSDSYGISLNSGYDQHTTLQNCIIKKGTSVSMYTGGITVHGSSNVRFVRIYNNVIYGYGSNTQSGMQFDGINSTFYVYNNTSARNYYGYIAYGGTVVVKNNISYGNADNWSSTFDSFSTDNLSGPGSDADIPATNARNGVTVTFKDEANDDFHLAYSDEGAKDHGADLHADADLPFRTDIDGQVRPYPEGGDWDIGADEQAFSAELGSTDSSAGPIAYYDFNEGFGDTAHNKGSGTSIDGTLSADGSGTNATTTAMWDKGGKYAGAMEFDGNDYVSVTRNASLEPANAVSVSAWVKGNSQGNYKYIVSKYDSTSVSSYGLYTGSSGGLVFYVYTSVGTYMSPNYGTGVWNNQWHHVLGVYDGSKVHLYVDGKESGSGTNASGSIHYGGADNLYIGSYKTDQYFISGLIDEVKIFNYALTADQVKVEYNGGMALQMGAAASANNNGTTVTGAATEYCIPGDTARCDKPVGEWSFNEKVSGNGQILYDTSGNGNNGTSNDGANNTGMNCAVPGKMGTGCQFDGVDDYTEAGSDPIGTGTVTISAWINSSTTNDTGTVFANGRTWLQIQTNYDRVLFTSNNGSNYLSPFPTFNSYKNRWVHLVVVRLSDGTATIYLNGTAVSGPSSSGTPVAGSTNLRVGGANGSSFNGKIDQVRIYGYARTPAQIAWEYNKGKPIAEYRFNECQGSTVYDESGNGNNGTINLGASGNTTPGTCTAPTDGTGAWYDGRNGKYGASLDFDGVNDYVDVTDSSDLHLTSFSLSLWYKADSWITSSYPRLISKRSSDVTMDWELYYDTANNYIKMVLGENSASASFSASNPSTGVWHHLIVTRNGTTLTLYSDGNYVESATNTATWTDSDDIYIGSREGTSRYFDGQIDDVKVFNYALTAQQVEALYNNGAVNFGN